MVNFLSMDGLVAETLAYVREVRNVSRSSMIFALFSRTSTSFNFHGDGLEAAKIFE